MVKAERKVIDIQYERDLREGEALAESEYDRPHSFNVETEDGLKMHINGDPRMSDETLATIMELGRHVMAMWERGELPHQRNAARTALGAHGEGE